MASTVFVKLFCGDFGSSSTLCVSDDNNQLLTVQSIKEELSHRTGIPSDIIHLYHGSCHLHSEHDVQNGEMLHVQLQLRGGKGGFGSMLRAIGAQIEKTTNKEACRDLSGRRLRDINEEKRLKKWIAKQAEREREKAERKRLRLERMRAAPHHEFHDSTYDKQRSNLAESITDSLIQGLQKKRKGEPIVQKSKVAKSSVKPQLEGWVGGVDEEPQQESCSSTDSEDGTTSSDDSTSSSNTSGSDQPSCSHEDQSTRADSSLDTSSAALVTNSLSQVEDESMPSGSQCHATTTKPQLQQEPEALDLEGFNSIEELEEVGLDRLKCALMALGMKCGGTLRQRAERLFSVKGLKKEDIAPSLLAKPVKSK